MASRTVVSRRERIRQIHEEEQHQAEEPMPPEPAPRPRRRRRWLLLATLGLLVMVWLLPGVVAHTPLLGWVVGRATADLDGELSVGRASLGWFSPIEAERIEIRDPQGQPVLTADKVAGNKPLIALLLDPTLLGKFRVESPELTVELRDDGSNVEDLLAEYLKPSDEPSSTASLAVEVVDGAVTVRDGQSGRQWPLRNVQLSLATSTDGTGRVEIEASGETAEAHPRSGLSVSLSMNTATESSSVPSGTAKIAADALPLAVFQPLAARFLPGTRLDGRLTLRIETRTGTGQSGEVSVEADVAAEEFVFTTEALGDDRLELAQLEASCRLDGQTDRVKIRRSSLRCDLGELSAAGTLQLTPGWTARMAAWAVEQAVEIRGEADLVRLAAMLPDTLRIRRDTQITSGRARVSWIGRAETQGMAWQGEIRTSDLGAEHAGRHLSWERPVQLSVTAHQAADGPVVDELRCDSQFLKIHAAGNRRNLAASASFDLAQLHQQLGQFVDFDGVELAGNGWAHVNWQSADARSFETDGELQLRDFQLVLPGQLPWREANLLVFLSASGSTDFGKETQLRQATLQVGAGSDRIDAKLLQPVLDLRRGGTWPVKITAVGQLENWPGRLTTWVDLGGYRMAGNFQMTADATVSADAVYVRNGQLTAERLQLASAAFHFDEPRLEARLAGSWNQTRRRLHLQPASLTTSAASVHAGDLVMGLPEGAEPELSGTLEFHGRLEQLQQWIPNAGDWRTAGQLDGTAVFEQSEGRVRGRVEADIADLVLVSSTGQRIEEPTVRVAAAGDYEHAARLLQFEKLRIVSETIDGELHGRLATAAEQPDLQVDGQLQYDLERITALLQPHLGNGVRMGGRGLAPASYRGPLSVDGATAGLQFGWQWADVYGFSVGPGQIQAELSEGRLAIEPVELTVSGGRVQMAPQLQLAPAPGELTLPPGPLATRVQITPAMCDTALKYIAPVLAGVTEAQGDFSIEMTDCHIPLDDPAQGKFAGTFTVHDIQIGAGPLVREMAVVLGYSAPARLRRESVVRFRMAEGRVHHEGLELIFPDVTIRTHGSVGLDQTLALLAEMPIPQKWIGDNPLGSAIKDQTIQLPVGGTLSRPQLDRRELRRYTGQFLQKGVQNVLENEVGRQLDRLFGPPE